jgi:hypothetical protein
MKMDAKFSGIKLNYFIWASLIALLSTVFIACGSTQKAAEDINQNLETSLPANEDLGVSLLKNSLVQNKAAYIPSQCYTRTNVDNEVHNPCFSCHTQGQEPNFVDDSSFQLKYEFRNYSQTNHWDNLFKDRSTAVAAISDADIMNYVRTSNYFTDSGDIALAEHLARLPINWDFDGNGKWDGYVPDCYFAFDDEGFDVTPRGQDTGWRAFSYAPFLGTFWPTNGSTDDVLIRLSPAFRQTEKGVMSRKVYKLNLSIVLALIQRKNIPIESTDESLFDVDLNKNGQIDTASEVVYDWSPTQGRFMSYVGKAKLLQQSGEVHIAAGLYPEGTEFLHSVRYINIDNNGDIQLAARMKELRYARKLQWNNYTQLRNQALSEQKEADISPELLRTIIGDAEFGLANGQGWIYQGFIENAEGKLRPQNYEESVACIGCHSGIGVTVDSSYAFARKLDAKDYQGGWSHWTQKGIKGIPEPKYSDGSWQYSEYLINNKSANEFRNNDEVIARFWDQQGNIKTNELDLLHNDMSHLLLPGQQRAIALNKAYKVIVNEQSYIQGRDAHVKPLDDVVWKEVPTDELTGVSSAVIKQF